ncbi:MAG: nitroreductase family protein [Lachnospiraceae bacterium]|nr:nitroreductase family protein [Lachnospiraceae bacterium]MBR1855593.1 nitroreductase family protein [Oribacterium sp.]
MSFLDLAAERFSVRSFSDREVEQEKIDLILKAAQLAPTAVNYQPQRIYVLKSEAAMNKINRLCRCIYGAPMVFLICSDERRTWKSQTERGYSTGEMDCSIVCTHMMLEAWEQGLGSVWVRLFDVNAVAKAFDIPEYIKPICLLPVGYASNDCVPYAPGMTCIGPSRTLRRNCK